MAPEQASQEDGNPELTHHHNGYITESCTQAELAARIMGVRVVDNSLQYLISWTDANRAPSWEQASVFQGTAVEGVYQSETML